MYSWWRTDMQYIKTLKIQTQLTNFNLFKIYIYILHCIIYLYNSKLKWLVEPEWETEKKKENFHVVVIPNLTFYSINYNIVKYIKKLFIIFKTYY